MLGCGFSRLLPDGDLVHYLSIAGVGLRNSQSQRVLHIAINGATQHDRPLVSLDPEIGIRERRFGVEMFLNLLFHLRGGQRLWRGAF
jgi:hypothetical protein